MAERLPRVDSVVKRKYSSTKWIVWFVDDEVVQVMSDSGNRSRTVKKSTFLRDWVVL